MEEGNAIHRGYVILFSVISLIIGGVIGYCTPRAARDRAPLTVSMPPATSTPLPTPTPAPIRVYISGAVRHPAVYVLQRGSIVEDALDVAGGTLPEADLARINLALELQDQQQVHVPQEGEVNPPPVISGGVSESAGVTGGIVNINTATAKELETLPGVGEVTARRIIDYREAHGPFETIEDIQNVPGIGVKTFEGIQDSIGVGP